MKTILISGANGFIAKNFIEQFSNKYKFILLSHQKITGHITYEELNQQAALLKEIDVVLNLAGENIGAKKWDIERKNKLINSRLDSTQKLVTIFNQHNINVHFISASAIGIYPTGIKCDENTTIDYTQYQNFSQEITRRWEGIAHKYNGNLTITRFGVVLSGNGGAFPKMLQPFKMFAGGKIGSGKQYFSWIALPDLLSALEYIIDNHKLGTYNLTAPTAIINKELSQNIANTWHRPNLFPLPEFMVKLLFGQMGEELFLSSLEVIPKRLTSESFKFSYPTFESCINAIHAKEF